MSKSLEKISLEKTEEGAAVLVRRVSRVINHRFHDADKPNIVFTDRGRCFFNPATGHITSGFAAALRENDLVAFMRSDASKQPGELQELMLHETAVSWLNSRLAATNPKTPFKSEKAQ